jgi:type IV secretory pathway component VirB8
MSKTDRPIEEYKEIAEKIRSGEFFRESRTMYDFAVHDIMAERYFYLLLTGLSVFIFLVAIVAMQGFYPLQRSVPFIVSTANMTDDRPSIRSLITHKGEDPSEAFLRFMIQNYVGLWEEYDIDLIDRNTSGVRSQSSDEVYREFERLMDPRNPQSPIATYQRHSKRKIRVISTRLFNDSNIQVIFEADVERKNEIQKSRWQADIAFSYSGITLNKETEKVDSFNFVVTQYKVKRLQDIK